MWVPLTPLDFYRRSARLFGGKVGVVDGERRLGFASFAERVERLAGALRAAGLRPRDTVSALGPNTHHLLEACYGVPLAGGVIHPVNPHRSPLEIAELVNDAGSRFLLVHASAAGIVREVVGNLKAVEQLVVLEAEREVLGFPALEYEALLARATPHAPDLSGLDENAPCALFHTSGGATKPKGVVLSHRALALHAFYAAIATGLREDDVSLCSVPFSYMNGGGNPQLDLAVGARSVLARRTDPETLLPLVEKEGVTVWITAPTVLQRMLRSPLLAQTDCSSLRLVLVGGAPVPEATLAEAQERLQARCLEVYGLTETSPYVAQATAVRPAGAGLPVLGVEVRVVDDTGREVAHDGSAVGEVLLRGNHVMTAYHHDPEATQEALRGGWLHTGDLAVIHEDGALAIRGRTKDVILVDGRRVAAREVEAALASHLDVVECGVIAAPDPDHGEVPVAVVALRRGARSTEQDLIHHARERLAAFKLPRRVEFLESLPRTEAGELLKSELRTLYARS